MRPSTVLSSRLSRRRIDCAASRGGVDGANFPVALLGLILTATMAAPVLAKADLRAGQSSQKMSPLGADEAIQSHVAEADLRVGQSAQKASPLHADAAIQTHVAEAARRFRIPAAWIWAVMHAESAGDVRARSKKGAMGLMQIMPATWILLRTRQGLGDDPYDPRDNILAGAAYLRDLHDRYGMRGFLAAYNAGPGRYEDHLAGRRSLPAETVDYVSTVGRRIDLGVSLDAAPPADERIAAQRSALFPPSMVALSAVQLADEKRLPVRSPADQLMDEARSIRGTSTDQATRENPARSRSFSDRVAVDLSAIAPSSTGLFARVMSR